jgi:ABC-type tungstate transport system substrate-binding protein
LVVFDRGSLRIARWQGSSLRLHWSFPVGVALFTGWMGLAPGAWVGFLVVSMVHLLGHQLLAFTCRIDVEASVLHLLGGDVRPRAGSVTTPIRRAVVGWGGLLAQAILLGIVELAVAMRG